MREDSITYENKFWTFFGRGEGWDQNRCDHCTRLLEREKKPNRYCIDCWKLELFYSNLKDTDEVKKYLLEEAKKDPGFHGKWSKFKLQQPGEGFTSIPTSAHPDPDVKKEGVILIYTQSIMERERRRKKIFRDLKKQDLYMRDEISFRRGCLNFDEKIGSWKNWYDLEKDFSENGFTL